MTLIVYYSLYIENLGLYLYFFLAPDPSSPTFQFASNLLRPIFQWLSLLSSSLNPIIYVMYSQKYRRAFNQILLYPCQAHYDNIRQTTWNNVRKSFKNGADGKSIWKKEKRDDSNISKSDPTTNISLIEQKFEETSTTDM
jgi:hypothetical protein